MLNTLIIEDDKDSCILLKLMLEQSCPELRILSCCQSGYEGLKSIMELKPDIVFLDIDMPKLNGFEMLELVENQNFEVIITTAHEDYAIQAFKVSAADYLLKPFDERELEVCLLIFLCRKAFNSIPTFSE